MLMGNDYGDGKGRGKTVRRWLCRRENKRKRNTDEGNKKTMSVRETTMWAVLVSSSARKGKKKKQGDMKKRL